MLKIIFALVIVILLVTAFIYKSPWFLYLAFTKPENISPHFISQPKKEEIPPYPTLNSIFRSDHNWTNTLSNEKKITLIATGDVIPARSVNAQTIKQGDPLWAYRNIASVVSAADLTFINLETPLITNCPITEEGMVFCGDIRHIQGLQLLGVDIASLGNNHAGNHGIKGVQDTVRLLETHNIAATGVDDASHAAVIKKVKGVKFGFLGYDDITTPQPGVLNTDLDRIKADIAKLKSQVDVVIVTYHWGVEYRAQPDDRQKFLGHFTIDNGADLVIGNHPHWIQPVEFYKGKLITYAHGNTIFDQMWSQPTREGVIGRYTFYGKNLVDVKYLPLQIDNYGQPHFLEGTPKEKILENMFQESLKLPFK
jgi:poly-gamma-glutamate capsule biosynthesis protein CapA/YwtB (metallophosphatase superfamily)